MADITIRIAEHSDSINIWEWRNDSETRRNSNSEDEITWARSILELGNELESNSGSFKDINNEMVDEAVIKRARIIIESIEDDLNKP